MLDNNAFFIREHVGMFKLTDTYDILDPETQRQIGVAKEEPPEWAKYLRLLVGKMLLPTKVNVYQGDDTGPIMFSIQRGIAFIAPKVEIHDGAGQYIGYLKGKIFSLGGGFWVHDARDRQIAEVKGDWVGWNFKFLNTAGNEVGVITKKWAGVGKELFTTADNYMVCINEGFTESSETKALLLSAALAVDIIYKEKQ